MYKVAKELVSSSKSHCKVGKIISLKKGAGDSCAIQIDFKTEAFKKSNVLFTEKVRSL
ncbi:hypothetical protein [Flavobacterium sp. N3904]|uniref:hypothetical protein n=1 Tax=Flavobacterium sp. N3904 TaxID=2986835 RepID=UPI0022252878|nr:hypothetical protein [Flavobacterium sp. N3904]